MDEFHLSITSSSSSSTQTSFNPLNNYPVGCANCRLHVEDLPDPDCLPFSTDKPIIRLSLDLEILLQKESEASLKIYGIWRALRQRHLVTLDSHQFDKPIDGCFLGRSGPSVLPPNEWHLVGIMKDAALLAVLSVGPPIELDTNLSQSKPNVS